MNHEEWLARAEIYALGALDGEDLTLFEAHLASGCSSCETRLRETQETLTLLPRSRTPLAPPPAVKARLLAQIAGEASRPQEKRLPGWLSWGVGAGALVAASLLIVLGWNLSVTRQEMQRLKNQVAALGDEVNQQQEVVRFLSDPQVRFVQLAGLAPSPAATGRLLWNPVKHAGLFLSSGLPPTPSGKAYELWAIAGSEPVPAGVFTVDQGGRVLYRLPPLPETKTFDKFAVTLEPASGVPKPSGAMYLLGSL
ncbi:MAG: anti-sigma factor [Candidatus Tectomicrobia bacterium]|uniref:Regulator of SigK n=1 Tax=Tectimicrobiota bacterium TaxID=2528274 RepID=A0A932GPI9_UNCTE|nr:anti-sigma factor [Candidatus Tectomicrobia bacterium]